MTAKQNTASPPVRGRGLKLWAHDCQAKHRVAPRAGAWIETFIHERTQKCGQSPPVRGRGLKLVWLPVTDGRRLSPPVRGRGLKHADARGQQRHGVAPRAGAWIETRRCERTTAPRRRPPCGGGRSQVSCRKKVIFRGGFGSYKFPYQRVDRG